MIVRYLTRRFIGDYEPNTGEFVFEKSVESGYDARGQHLCMVGFLSREHLLWLDVCKN